MQKKFDLKIFNPPKELVYEDLRARPITREDLKDDLAAVNTSHELIRKTRGGSWPEGELTEEFDFLDLAWHEREFREKSSLAYVVYDNHGVYIGCFYLYPMGVRTLLNPDTENYDVDASWWVTAKAYQNGDYNKLFAGLQDWLKEFPFKNPYYSNQEIPKTSVK